jgi:hypothetical protein
MVLAQTYLLGDALRDADDEGNLVLDGIKASGARKGRGHIDGRSVGLDACNCLLDRVEDGEPQVRGAALLGGHA